MEWHQSLLSTTRLHRPFCGSTPVHFICFGLVHCQQLYLDNHIGPIHSIPYVPHTLQHVQVPSLQSIFQTSPPPPPRFSHFLCSFHLDSPSLLILSICPDNFSTSSEFISSYILLLLHHVINPPSTIFCPQAFFFQHVHNLHFCQTQTSHPYSTDGIIISSILVP